VIIDERFRDTEIEEDLMIEEADAIYSAVDARLTSRRKLTANSTYIMGPLPSTLSDKNIISVPNEV
jgi:hypothetical protein